MNWNNLKRFHEFLIDVHAHTFMFFLQFFEQEATLCLLSWTMKPFP